MNKPHYDNPVLTEFDGVDPVRINLTPSTPANSRTPEKPKSGGVTGDSSTPSTPAQEDFIVTGLAPDGRVVVFDPALFRRKPVPIKRRSIAAEVRAAVWEKTGGTCVYCGRQCNPFVNFEVDHILPVARGGSNDLSNLAPSCGDCNRRKGTRSEPPTRGRFSEFAVLIGIDSGLLGLELDITNVVNSSAYAFDPHFCANETWYGAFKPRLEQLVGWTARNERLRTEQAYDIAYDHLYSLLPACRDCFCSEGP